MYIDLNHSMYVLNLSIYSKLLNIIMSYYKCSSTSCIVFFDHWIHIYIYIHYCISFRCIAITIANHESYSVYFNICVYIIDFLRAYICLLRHYLTYDQMI